MRKIIQFFSLTVLYLFSSIVCAQHQVVFFYIPEGYKDRDQQDVVEIQSDFFLYMNNIKPWLKEKDIKHSIMDKYGFTVNTNDKTIMFTKEILKSYSGYIIVKTNGEFEISRSFGTGVDMMYHISNYLGIKAF